MPAATMAWAAPTVLGGLGLMQAENQRKSQSKANAKAQKATDKGLAIQEREAKEREGDRAKLRTSIEGYDYGADTKRAVDAASEQTGSVLEQRMRALNADFRGAGGVPGNSSEFRVRSQGVTNQTMSPLWAFVADRVAAEREAKMRDQAILLGQPVGQLSDGYFRAANALASTGGPSPNYAPSLQMLMQGLIPKKAMGAGGSGDIRYDSNGIPGGSSLYGFGGAVNS